jgi:putative methionine-R-sulfoxide reductase with GAF domain
MDSWERLWKESVRLTQASPLSDVEVAMDQCLALKLPWTTRLAGMLGIVHQVLGDDTGVSFYGVTRALEPLVLVSAAGKAGPLAVAWGVPVAGFAAQEQASQFAGDARALADYQGGWLGVKQCVAVPVLYHQHLYGVLEVRSHRQEHLGLAQAELVAHAGARLAGAWPAN